MPVGYPTSNSNQIVAGAVDYFFLEQRLSTGAPLGTPDVANKIGYAAKYVLDYQESGSAGNDIIVKTNAVGREFTAFAAFDASGSASGTAPKVKVSIDLLESAMEDLQLPINLAGLYFILTLPLGLRGAKYVDLFLFGKFSTKSAISFEGAKESQIPLEFTVLNNTLAATAVVPTDDNVHAAAAVIAANGGLKFVGTAA